MQSPWEDVSPSHGSKELTRAVGHHTMHYATLPRPRFICDRTGNSPALSHCCYQLRIRRDVLHLLREKQPAGREAALSPSPPHDVLSEKKFPVFPRNVFAQRQRSEADLPGDRRGLLPSSRRQACLVSQAHSHPCDTATREL